MSFYGLRFGKICAFMAAPMVLAACIGGYAPMYSAEGVGEYADQVHIGSVVMHRAERNVGSRRVAQNVNYRLQRYFHGGEGARYTLDVVIDQSRRTLAVEEDATDERFEMVLRGRIIVSDEKGVVFRNTVVTRTAYDVEKIAFSTDVGQEGALLRGAEALGDAIHRNINHFYYARKHFHTDTPEERLPPEVISDETFAE